MRYICDHQKNTVFSTLLVVLSEDKLYKLRCEAAADVGGILLVSPTKSCLLPSLRAPLERKIGKEQYHMYSCQIIQEGYSPVVP